METAEFRRILHNGLGRALLYLRDHDAAPHREAILHARLHNTVFDRQVNGSNAEYIFEAIGLTGEATLYRDRLLEALRQPADEHHLRQICDLLRCFAQQGDRIARQALYDAFDQDEAIYETMFAIVELDGLSGFLHVADGVGASAEEDEEFWEGAYFLNQLDEKYGKEIARKSVAAAAMENPRIAAYLAAIEKEETKGASPKRTRFDPKTMGHDELRAMAANKASWSPARLRNWGKRASENDISRLAEDIVAETDPVKLHAYLCVFAERPFPNGPTPLFKFVDSSDGRVVHAAISALGTFRHPEVRGLALTLLNTHRAWAALDLLVSNYEEDDHLLVERALAQPAEQDEDEQHWFEMGVLVLFEQYPSVAATPSLRFIYERGRCFMCRYGTVELLHRLGTLPETIRRECEFDADFDLRAAARRHFRAEDATKEDATKDA